MASAAPPPSGRLSCPTPRWEEGRRLDPAALRIPPDFPCSPSSLHGGLGSLEDRGGGDGAGGERTTAPRGLGAPVRIKRRARQTARLATDAP